MIQTWLQIKDTITQLDLDTDKFIQVQKIFSTSRYICFCLRFPGKTKYLYLGRGNHYEGIWEGESPPPSEMRLRDRLLEFFRKQMVSTRLIGLEIDPSDRVITFSYFKWGKKNTISYFYAGRKSYFLADTIEESQKKRKVFPSWRRAVPEDLEVFPVDKLFGEVGKDSSQLNLEKRKALIPIDELLKDEKKSLVISDNKAFKKAVRKISKVENDLKKVQQWEAMKERIETDPSFLSEGYQVKVEGWRFKFESGLNVYQRRDIVYQKIKNLKKAEGFLAERLKDLKEMNAKGKMTTVRPARPIEPVWSDEKKTETTLLVEPEYTLIDLPRGLKVAIGKSARGNDYIRSKWAKKDYIWFHLEGQTSGHLIVNTSLDQLEQQDIVLFGNIIAKYSSYEALEIPLIYTQVSNLRSVKGTPGKVRYKKEKRICVILDQGILESVGV